jgi:hypothetical protein
MAFDYAELAQVASDLISEFGRQMIIRVNADVIPDQNKPWKATSSVATDTTVLAVEVPFTVDRPEGTHRSRDDKRYLIAGPSLTTIEVDHLLVDGGQVWAVTNPIIIRPGPTTVLYDVLVRKWPPRSNS